MLIVELIGGLGNQMFQYAFGQALSFERQLQVKFDIQRLLDRTPRLDYTFRDFELDAFRNVVPIATASDTALYDRLPVNKVLQLSQRVKRRFLGANRFVEKTQFVYDAEVLKTGYHTYFEGYWQNELYFKPYETRIRQAFELKAPLAGINFNLAQQIASIPASVSLHVRRGDYVSSAQANQVHGLCSPHYYEQAVQLMQAKLGDIHVFVFSDEPEWVKQNMRFTAQATYISHNTGRSSVEDLRLMSLCNHNIIANSSFSWWGAWLNANPQKIVIAPQYWYQNRSSYPLGFLPSEWMRL